jgi:alpha-galactosidase
MTVVSIIGAGSVTFTRTLVNDLLQRPATKDCELRLFDIDAGALDAAHRMVTQMREEAAAPGPVVVAHDLRSCVRDASYVICTILVGGRAAALRDFEVTARYGLHYTVGDTLGVTGISRGLRTIPVLIEVARACAEAAPEALLLNYTNPMGMLVSAIGRSVGFPTIGLCHSAEFTIQTLAGYLDLPSSRLRWWSAGINHIAWVLSLTGDGTDLYPDLARAAGQAEVYDQDRVRFEIMKRVGYFVTESSMHVSEYLPYFITKPAEVERLKVPVDQFLRRKPVPISKQLELAREQGGTWLGPLSNEYAPALIAARESNSDWVFQANVMNDSLIDNLSAGMCVEVPCAVSGGKVAPVRVGKLPAAPAALCQQGLTVQELTVEAVLQQNRDLLCEAVMMDPQASALLTVRSIWELVDDLLKAHPELPEFRSGRLAMFEKIPQ